MSQPIDPNTGEQLPLMEQPGYYPGYSTLKQKKYWEAATRELVIDRVTKVPPIRFFTPAQAELLTAVCNRVLPQDDREPAFRIPIVPRIDDRLHAGRHDGYRFEDMPDDGAAYLLFLTILDELRFLQMAERGQELILKAIHDGNPPGNPEIWKQLPVKHMWMLLVADCAEAYYSHPWAWDEIGYGGPAYPRAYMRLERGEPEPWEVEERRYEWSAPRDSVSGGFSPIAGGHDHHGGPSQGGTH